MANILCIQTNHSRRLPYLEKVTTESSDKELGSTTEVATMRFSSTSTRHHHDFITPLGQRILFKPRIPRNTRVIYQSLLNTKFTDTCNHLTARPVTPSTIQNDLENQPREPLYRLPEPGRGPLSKGRTEHFLDQLHPRGPGPPGAWLPFPWRWVRCGGYQDPSAC